MFRHAICLDNYPWVLSGSFIKPGTDIQPDDPAVRVVKHPFGHQALFRAAFSENVLEIAADVIQPDGWSYQPKEPHPQWYLKDHIVIFIDPAHNHATQRMIAILRDSGNVKTDQWLLAGEEVSDRFTVPLDFPPLNPEISVKDTPKGWQARIRFDVKRFADGVDAGQRVFPNAPLGLQLRLGIEGPVIYDAPSFPANHPFWKDTPFANCDALAPDSAVAIQRVDFGSPVWKTGALSSSVVLSGETRGNQPMAGICQIGIQDTLGKKTTKEYPWSSKDGKISVAVPVDYPFESKWAPNCLKIARLTIELTDSKANVSWRAEYPFGFDAGIIVREPFHIKDTPAARIERPSQTDPDFVDSYRNWLLTFLPDWTWKTTRDGYPSDFFLSSSNERDDINLMSPTIYTDLAELIVDKFNDWRDGLCAASMLLHHPCISVHSPSWAKIATNADTETVIRLGGCFCSDIARVAARLVDELSLRYRVPLKGYVLGLRGHICTLVETSDGATVIDPMLGIYYHTKDNYRLATLDELRENIALQQRMWLLARSDAREFFHNVYNQEKRLWINGPTQYPPAQ